MKETEQDVEEKLKNWQSMKINNEKKKIKRGGKWRKTEENSL